MQSIFGNDTVWKQCSFNTWSNQHKLGGTPLEVTCLKSDINGIIKKWIYITTKAGNDYILIEKNYNGLQWQTGQVNIENK